MYNNPKLRQSFYWLLGLGFCLQYLSLIFNQHLQPSTSLGETVSWWQQFLLSIPHVIKLAMLWVGVGYVFNLKKEAQITIIAQVVVYALGAVLYYNILGRNHPYTRLVLDIINLLPYAVFGWLVFKDKRALGVVLLGFILALVYQIGITTGKDPRTLAIIFRWLDLTNFFFINLWGLPNKIDFLHLITQSLAPALVFLLLSYGIKMLQRKLDMSSLSNIDLSNQYSTAFATILFLVFNFELMMMHRIYLFFSGFDWYALLNIIRFLVFVYLVALVYRNFLVEFSLQRHGKVGWWYFLLGIPVINIFAWLFVMFNPPLIKTKAQLEEAFEAAKDNDNASIKGLLLFLTIGMGILLVVASHGNIIPAIITALIGFAMLAWFLSSPSGLWGLITITGVIIALSFQSKFSITQLVSLESTVNNFITLIIWFPLFHFSLFRNVETNDKKPSLEDQA